MNDLDLAVSDDPKSSRDINPGADTFEHVRSDFHSDGFPGERVELIPELDKLGVITNQRAECDGGSAQEAGQKIGDGSSEGMATGQSARVAAIRRTSPGAFSRRRPDVQANPDQ